MLLEVRDLRAGFHLLDDYTEALSGVSFFVNRGEIYCLLGESGSGKTGVLRSIMRLLPGNAEYSGEVLFEGKNLFELSEEEMVSIRGCQISMVFQEPMTSLNPTMRIGDQVAEVLEFHYGIKGKKARERVIELLERLGIENAKERYFHYPHLFSGGMRQRVMIAMAVIAEPKLILADEPTTALDVTVQNQILKLLVELVKEKGSSLLFVTHDFSVAAEIGDRVGLLYRGYMVEEGPVEEVLKNPLHPYTKDLIEAIPLPGKRLKAKSITQETSPDGACPYYFRCEKRTDICRTQVPEFKEVNKGHRVRCFLC